METALYRNRIYRDRLVEAVLYTSDNDREMFEWVPGKQHYEPGGRINGLNIFTPEGRRHAVWGDWVYRDKGTDRFWATCQDAFDDDYEPVHSLVEDTSAAQRMTDTGSSSSAEAGDALEKLRRASKVDWPAPVVVQADPVGWVAGYEEGAGTAPKPHEPLCVDKIGHPHDNECECWCHDETDAVPNPSAVDHD